MNKSMVAVASYISDFKPENGEKEEKILSENFSPASTELCVAQTLSSWRDSVQPPATRGADVTSPRLEQLRPAANYRVGQTAEPIRPESNASNAVNTVIESTVESESRTKIENDGSAESTCLGGVQHLAGQEYVKVSTSSSSEEMHSETASSPVVASDSHSNPNSVSPIHHNQLPSSASDQHNDNKQQQNQLLDSSAEQPNPHEIKHTRQSLQQQQPQLQQQPQQQQQLNSQQQDILLQISSPATVNRGAAPLLSPNGSQRRKKSSDSANLRQISIQTDINHSSPIFDGARFYSFAEFMNAFEEWKQTYHHPFRVASSESLRQPDDGMVYEVFKYRYIVYHCAFYGKPRMRGIGKRPNQNYLPCGCNAMLRLNFNHVEHCLKITTLKSEHTGHDISEANYKRVSTKLRKISPSNSAGSSEPSPGSVRSESSTAPKSQMNSPTTSSFLDASYSFSNNSAANISCNSDSTLNESCGAQPYNLFVNCETTPQQKVYSPTQHNAAAPALFSPKSSRKAAKKSVQHKQQQQQQQQQPQPQQQLQQQHLYYQQMNLQQQIHPQNQQQNFQQKRQPALHDELPYNPQQQQQKMGNNSAGVDNSHNTNTSHIRGILITSTSPPTHHNIHQSDRSSSIDEESIELSLMAAASAMSASSQCSSQSNISHSEHGHISSSSMSHSSSSVPNHDHISASSVGDSAASSAASAASFTSELNAQQFALLQKQLTNSDNNSVINVVDEINESLQQQQQRQQQIQQFALIQKQLKLKNQLDQTAGQNDKNNSNNNSSMVNMTNELNDSYHRQRMVGEKQQHQEISCGGSVGSGSVRSLSGPSSGNLSTANFGADSNVAANLLSLNLPNNSAFSLSDVNSLLMSCDSGGISSQQLANQLLSLCGAANNNNNKTQQLLQPNPSTQLQMAAHNNLSASLKTAVSTAGTSANVMAAAMTLNALLSPTVAPNSSLLTNSIAQQFLLSIGGANSKTATASSQQEHQQLLANIMPKAATNSFEPSSVTSALNLSRNDSVLTHQYCTNSTIGEIESSDTARYQQILSALLSTVTRPQQQPLNSAISSASQFNTSQIPKQTIFSESGKAENLAYLSNSAILSENFMIKRQQQMSNVTTIPFEQQQSAAIVQEILSNPAFANLSPSVLTAALFPSQPQQLSTAVPPQTPPQSQQCQQQLRSENSGSQQLLSNILRPAAAAAHSTVLLSSLSQDQHQQQHQKQQQQQQQQQQDLLRLLTQRQQQKSSTTTTATAAVNPIMHVSNGTATNGNNDERTVVRKKLLEDGERIILFLRDRMYSTQNPADFVANLTQFCANLRE